MVILTDTHTHLYAEAFDADRSDMVQRALDAGVTRLFLPNIDSHSIPGLFSLAKQFPENCFPMMGLHPCSVNEEVQKELKVVEHWLGQRKFFAVGEIGIDLYWDKTFVEQQQYAFDFQIKLAKKHKLPIVIHTRNAFEEAYEIVRKNLDQDLRGIFHCFSGTIEEAEKIIALGSFKLGIGGVLTFKKSGLDNVLEQIPLEHMVLETDAPYLAPTPHRGKRNESSYLKLIAEKLAEVKRTRVEEVVRITTENSKTIFGV
ncbi:MAG TPA: TatD family hydrolase [Bacteroidia bacterium]|jgi:TatD DNase family protein|nr:TatD family hydrolase [Bacteroidia bacterium]